MASTQQQVSSILRPLIRIKKNSDMIIYQIMGGGGGIQHRQDSFSTKLYQTHLKHLYHKHVRSLFKLLCCRTLVSIRRHMAQRTPLIILR